MKLASSAVSHGISVSVGTSSVIDSISLSISDSEGTKSSSSSSSESSSMFSGKKPKSLRLNLFFSLLVLKSSNLFLSRFKCMSKYFLISSPYTY